MEFSVPCLTDPNLEQDFQKHCKISIKQVRIMFVLTMLTSLIYTSLKERNYMYYGKM